MDFNAQGTVTENLGGLGESLISEDRTKVADINLIRRAARERWPIPEAKRALASQILMRIAETDTVTIVNDEGNSFEVNNARNQVAAIRALAALDTINQSDDHLADKNERLDSGKLTENHGFMPAIIEQPVRITG